MLTGRHLKVTLKQYKKKQTILCNQIFNEPVGVIKLLVSLWKENTFGTCKFQYNFCDKKISLNFTVKNIVKTAGT